MMGTGPPDTPSGSRPDHRTVITQSREVGAHGHLAHHRLLDRTRTRARGSRCSCTARTPSSPPANVAQVQDIADAYPGTALALPLDVTDDAQVTAAVTAAGDRFGGVDVLVNNAGYGYRAAVEEGDDDDVRRLFDTQLFGTVRTVKAVLPSMRARRSGTIVNLSSIGARISPEGSGYYAAVKAAIEALTLSLRKEVAPLGITAMVVEPGAFRTDFAGRSLTQSAEPIADYADTAGKRRKEHDTVHGTQKGDPAKARRGAHPGRRIRQAAVHAAARQTTPPTRSAPPSARSAARSTPGKHSAAAPTSTPERMSLPRRSGPDETRQSPRSAHAAA